MSRHDADRLADIVGAIGTTRRRLKKEDLHNRLVYDAARGRPIELSDAVKSTSRARRPPLGQPVVIEISNERPALSP